MDNVVYYKLIGEVKQRCRFAQFAFRELRNSLQAVDSEKVFFYTHALLDHALEVSKLFWPRREQSQERGKSLREDLKVADSSSVRLGSVREQLERGDEQLEDWISRQENKNYVDMNVMAQGTMAGFKADNFHRSLDPENFKLRLRGEDCDLRHLSDELQKIESAADLWQRTHNPW